MMEMFQLADEVVLQIQDFQTSASVPQEINLLDIQLMQGDLLKC